MFTGLVEESGRVVELYAYCGQHVLRVAARRVLEGLAIGDSLAVNGCCLTVAAREGDVLQFDLLAETRRVTSLAALVPGSEVNLERSLAYGGRMGGHFVTGHVDAVGTIEAFEPRGTDHYLRVRLPAGSGRYLISKGSIALDGVSLTVAEVGVDTVVVWLIPHTLAVTNLHTRRVGDVVNVEFDVLGKYVERMLEARLGAPGGAP
ncbi:MAG: riboflavin synthase [Verrucomicrobia bacterium]|nr:riboflavin synthase [Verrucomicrobiota bacterium]